ncbi:hypothetical protein [Corynebacterium pseudopelargi]|uniref:Lipoprotein n=1 Tax=Corynebacterium pseudopelargi TaxID=2080757 RepID=A0A3G6IVT5_9CORY|nr:hypothetical protein [Corynebacterium pseudopelargi]AZA09756.1 hypothetical protein CPPEL_08260 [Corynebacterium pseudopelargi]
MRFNRIFAAIPCALLLGACSSSYQAHLSAEEAVLRIELKGAKFVEEDGVWVEVGSQRAALPTEEPANGFGGITHFDYELESQHVLKVQSHKTGPTDRMWRGPFGECFMRKAQADYTFEQADEIANLLKNSAQRC